MKYYIPGYVESHPPLFAKNHFPAILATIMNFCLQQIFLTNIAICTIFLPQPTAVSSAPFCHEISKIRDTFATSGSFNDAPDSVPPAFNAFMPVTEDEVYKCISESPTKSCSLDPIPTFLLKDCLDILLSSITKLVNYSLIEGSFPNSFKKAVVTPLIKKASLPRDDLKNYRPVSGLCFLSKLVE